jgi:hypothetical protein
MSEAPAYLLRSLLFAALVALTIFVAPGETLATGNTIASPDSGGQYTSIALDALGNPVVSHYDPSTGDLKTVHCSTPSCGSANVLASPDTTNDVGQYSSLRLDASGHPVVSYFDATLGDLKVLHCGNSDCTSGNTIRSPDSSPLYRTGHYSSLALDASGNPVVSYFEVPHDGLKVTHCGDPACNSWAANFADPGNILGLYSSIALDAAGFPVVSYFDETNGDLKVVHCGNANCSAGNTIVSPDTPGEVGRYTSIALDSGGRPVVSYYDQTGGKLKILHCGDANCSSGNSITAPDGAGASNTSLKLDGSGNPVASYYSSGSADLRILHCSDPNCTAGNSITTPDLIGDVGQYSSLILDAGGNPVVSYYDATNGTLKVLHCSDSTCAGTKPPPTVGGITELPDVVAPGSGAHTTWLLGIGALAVLLVSGGAIAWRVRTAG